MTPKREGGGQFARSSAASEGGLPHLATADKRDRWSQQFRASARLKAKKKIAGGPDTRNASQSKGKLEIFD